MPAGGKRAAPGPRGDTDLNLQISPALRTVPRL
jgi:hypothetical protein